MVGVVFFSLCILRLWARARVKVKVRVRVRVRDRDRVRARVGGPGMELIASPPIFTRLVLGLGLGVGFYANF